MNELFIPELADTFPEEGFCEMQDQVKGLLLKAKEEANTINKGNFSSCRGKYAFVEKRSELNDFTYTESELIFKDFINGELLGKDFSERVHVLLPKGVMVEIFHSSTYELRKYPLYKETAYIDVKSLYDDERKDAMRDFEHHLNQWCHEIHTEHTHYGGEPIDNPYFDEFLVNGITTLMMVYADYDKK